MGAGQHHPAHDTKWQQQLLLLPLPPSSLVLPLLLRITTASALGAGTHASPKKRG
jgi:hypothetical protein